MTASVMDPAAGRQVHMVLGDIQESPDNPALSTTQQCAVPVRGGGEWL